MAASRIGAGLNILDDIYLGLGQASASPGDTPDFRVRFRTSDSKLELVDAAANVLATITDNGSTATLDIGAITSATFDLGSPDAIGDVTPNTGAFTSLSTTNDFTVGTDGTGDIIAGAGNTTVALLNTVATTINFGAAASTGINIGHASGTITNLGLSKFVVSAVEGTPSIAATTVAHFQRAGSSASDALISYQAGTAGNIRLLFGDSDAQAVGEINYDNNDNSLTFLTNTAAALTLSSAQLATFAGNILIPDAGNIGCTSTPTLLAMASGALTVNGTLDVRYIPSTSFLERGPMASSFGSPAHFKGFTVKTADGTEGAPTGLAVGEEVGGMNFLGYDGTKWRLPAMIKSEVTAVTNNVSMAVDLEFWTGTVTGDASAGATTGLLKTLTLDSAQLATFAGNILIPDAGNIGCTSTPTLLAMASGALTIAGAVTTAGNFTNILSVDAPLVHLQYNMNAGTSAFSQISTSNGSGTSSAISMLAMGTGYTTIGGLKQDGGVLMSDLNLSGGLSLISRHTTGDVRIYAGGLGDGDLVATFDNAQLTTFAGDTKIDGGAIFFQEISAPTPVTNYGTLYTTTANSLRFQDGAGGDHLVIGDSYSDIWYNGAASTLTISTQNLFTQVTQFENVGDEDPHTNAVGSVSTNDITLGANGGGVYDFQWHASITIAGGAAKTALLCPGITLATPIVIASATAATPIVITTTGNHGLKNGDMFTVTGATGDTAVNGDFVASAVTATTIALINLSRTSVATGGTYDASTGSIVVDYPGDMVARAKISGTDLEHVAASGSFTMAGADVVEFYIANLDGTENVSVSLVNMEVMRLGD